MKLAFAFFVTLFMSFNSYAAAPLRWAADSQGGAPYVFQDPKDPNKVVGFEVDLANALAQQLGRSPVFVQNQWDGLIPGLARGDYDIALNGIEITEDRKKEVNFSTPYYATAEQLTVKKDDNAITALADLKNKSVGTLKSSLAERILNQYRDDHHLKLDVRTYDDQGTAYEDLAGGRTQAVLMDWPIALYTVDPARMKNAGASVGYMQYGIAMPKTNPALLADVNNALVELIRTGQLRAIYQRWGLWNQETKKCFADLVPDAPAAVVGDAPDTGVALAGYLKAVHREQTTADRLKEYATVYLPMLVKYGVPMTLAISVAGMAMAICVGLVLALANLYGGPVSRGLSRAYIEMVRGTPLLIQLLIIFYGLPRVGLRLNPFLAAVLGLGLNYGAYEAENYRAGIQSIPRGQMEAALALGMTRLQALRHVIIPQALRLTIPPVTNDFVSLLKDSSIVSVITMVELTKVYSELAAIRFDYIGLGLITAALYFLLGLPFVRLARYAEAKLSTDRRTATKPVRAVPAAATA